MFTSRHHRNKIKFHQSARFWGASGPRCGICVHRPLGHWAPPTSKDFPRLCDDANATFKLHKEKPLTIPATSVNSRLHLLIRCNQIVMHRCEILELWKYLKTVNVSVYSLHIFNTV